MMSSFHLLLAACSLSLIAVFFTNKKSTPLWSTTPPNDTTEGKKTLADRGEITMTVCLINEGLTKTNVAVLLYCNTIKDESICTNIKSADVHKSLLSFQPFS